MNFLSDSVFVCTVRRCVHEILPLHTVARCLASVPIAQMHLWGVGPVRLLGLYWLDGLGVERFVGCFRNGHGSQLPAEGSPKRGCV